MEAVPRLPMLSFELKSSPEATSFGKLKRYIGESYHEDPETYTKEVYELESLRSASMRPTTDVTGCSILKRYYSQLHSLQGRFPSISERQILNFSWIDVHSSMISRSSDIKYEMAAILYNIGCLHTELGSIDSRTSPEGMKIACTHFQCAAWAFMHLRENFPQILNGDLSPDMLVFMEQLNFAQAQECILEKSLSDNRKSAIVAKVTSQIISYYNSALASLMSGGDEGKLAEFVENKTFKKWKRYVKFKISYLSSILLLYQGQQAEEQQKMGERVTLFQAASDKLEEAKKESKGIMNIQQVNEALTFTSDVIEAKRKAAKNENEFIYHEEVPDISTISAVKGANLVNGIAFSVTDPEIMGEDIFHRIVPMKAHEASSLYSEEKATFLRKIAKKMEEKDVELKTFMSSLNIDPLNFEQSNNTRLPQDLVDRCADINGKPNAIPQLVASMSNLAETCAEVETMLHEINEILQEEEVREKNYQKTMGGRTSVHFGELNREFIKYQEAHNKAGESNETLRKAMGLHVSNLRTLAQPLNEIQLIVPVCQDNLNDESFKHLQNLLYKVNEMQSQRAHLYDSIREAAINDDITAQIVAWGDKKLEKLFKKELSKHDKNVALIEQNLFAQGNILKALTDTYARCAPSLKAVVETKHKREHFFSSLIASYDVYEDLLGKSAKGLEFYKKLQGNIQKLLARVRAARDVQDEERQQRLKSSKPNEPVMPKNQGPKLKDYLKSGGINKNDSQSHYIPTIRPSPLGSETTITSTCVTSTHTDKSISSYNYQNYEPSPVYSQYNYSGQVSASGVQPQPPPSYDSLNYTTPFSNQQTGYSNPIFQGQYGRTIVQPSNIPISSEYPANPTESYLNPSSSFQFTGTTGTTSAGNANGQNSNLNTSQTPKNSYLYGNQAANTMQYSTSNIENQYQYPSSQQITNQIYNYQQQQQKQQQILPQTISSFNNDQSQSINQYIQPPSVSPALSNISNEITNPVYNQNSVYDQMNLINSMDKMNVQNKTTTTQDPNSKANNYSGFVNPVQNTEAYSTFYPEYSTTSPYGNYQITANSQYITGYDQSGQNLNVNSAQQQQQLSGIHDQNTIYQQQIYGQNVTPQQNFISNQQQNIIPLPQQVQQQQIAEQHNPVQPTQQTQSYSSHPGYSFNQITGEYQYASGYQIDSNIQQEQSNYNSQYTNAGGERDNMNTQTSLSELNQQTQETSQLNYQYPTIINDNQPQQPVNTKININNEGTYFSLPYGFHSQTSTTDNNLTYQQQIQQLNQEQPIQQDQEPTYMPQNFQQNLTEMTNLNNHINNNNNSPSYKNPMTYISSNSDGGTSTTSSANYGESSMSSTPQVEHPGTSVLTNVTPHPSQPASQAISQEIPQPVIKPKNSNIDLLSGIDFSPIDLPIAALQPEVATKDIDSIFEPKTTILPQPLTPSECNNRVGEFVLSTKSSIGLNYDRKLSVDQDNISLCSDLSSIDQNFDWESASMKNEEFFTKVNSENDIGNVLLKYKDAFDDPKILKWFHKEIERLEKFMEGLNIKTLNGTTSLDGKWKELQDLLVKDEAKRTTTIAKLFPEKNRSVDCIPYDHSRVLLPTTTDDYINAVYVREIGTGTPQFILAQTPMNNSLEDFWSMIWSQKSKTVVCLHTPTEMLDPFWPQDINKESTYGDFSVTLLQQFDLSHCFERNMKVTLHGSDAILNLSILQIKSWAKNSPSHILGVADNIITAHRQQVKEFKQISSPVIINCLTGAERSGIVTVGITAILATQTKRPVLINVVDVWYRICSQRKCALKDIATLQLSLQLVLTNGHELLNKRGIMTSYQMKTAQTTKAIEKETINDPFSDLDPLWKLKQK